MIATRVWDSTPHLTVALNIMYVFSLTFQLMCSTAQQTFGMMLSLSNVTTNNWLIVKSQIKMLMSYLTVLSVITDISFNIKKYIILLKPLLAESSNLICFHL